jgi:hypothetical protein
MALRPVAAAPSSESKAGPGLPTAGRLESDAAAAADQPAVAATRPAEAGETFGAALDAAARSEPASDGEKTEVDTPAVAPRTSKLRDMSARPPAPRPAQSRRFGWPAAVAAVVGLVAVVGIGIEAYRLRDKPEQVVASHPAPVVAESAAPGKVADRAGGAADDAAADTAAAAPASGAAVPAPVAQSAGDAPVAAPSIPVAQRAALLVDAPDDPQRVKTYVGTVVWHLDSVSPGQGQPLATVIKADVDIPDAKLKVTMLMQKNPEPQLPASHTIEFHFLPQPDNTLGPVKQINVPEMRKDDDAPTGDPLTGVPVAITDNYFLVGLSRGAPESQNLRLLTERNWVDISLLFVSGKLGKLTFEKGAAGQHNLEDALKTWK